jgi:septal ring factor EnvC (AmiA/AmiB activator)
MFYSTGSNIFHSYGDQISGTIICTWMMGVGMMNRELKDMLQSVIREELAPVHQRLERIETRLENVETRLENVETRLESVETRVENVETRLERIETRLEALEADSQLIKRAVLETNESVKRYEAIQDSQQRIIELLSSRSIEQEAQLKRIV